MAPNASFRDYIGVVVGGAVVCAFVFAVSTTYRTGSGSSTQPLIRQSSNKQSSLRASTSSSTSPNIIFIMADDMGWNGIGYEDWDVSEMSDRYAFQQLSPNLQALSAAGIPIRNYYSQEVCTPSRASFLTGMFFSNSLQGRWPANNIYGVL
jgi:hypothetical protein